MENSKQFYKYLPKYNGFKWFGFDQGKHHFQKEIKRKGFAHIQLLESDIENPENFRSMLEGGYTRT